MTSRSAGGGFGLVVGDDLGGTAAGGNLAFGARGLDFGGLAFALDALCAGTDGVVVVGVGGGDCTGGAVDSASGGVGSAGTVGGKATAAAEVEAPGGSSRAAAAFERQNHTPALIADPTISNMPRPSSSGSAVDGRRPGLASDEDRDIEAAVLAITGPELDPGKTALGAGPVLPSN